jgi:hypothetical protein
MLTITKGFHSNWALLDIGDLLPKGEGRQFVLNTPGSGTYSVTATFAPVYTGATPDENDTFTLTADQGKPIASLNCTPCKVRRIAVKVVLNSGAVAENSVMTGVEA